MSGFVLGESISVASYNMSFASDWGKIGFSEGHNTKNNYKHAKSDHESEHELKRKGWEDSKALVIKWTTENPTFVIGMQEMNQRIKVVGKKGGDGLPIAPLFEAAGENAGLESIVAKLEKTSIEFVYYNGGITGYGDSFPSLLTIWSKSLGEIESTYVRDLCVAHNTNFEKYSKLIAKKINKSNEFIAKYGTDSMQEQMGRPITIVRTTLGFTFVNLHVINGVNGHSEYYTAFAEIFIQEKIKDMDLTNEDLNKLFIMGDFNDPNNKLNTITINGVVFGHGKSVMSCCYNFNTSCEKDLFDLGQQLITKDQDPSIASYSEHDNTEINHQELWEKFRKRYYVSEGKEDIRPSLKNKEHLFKIEVLKNQCPVIILKNPDEHPELKLIDESIRYSEKRSMHDAGKLQNYKFVGDYVFGLNLLESLKIYGETENGFSYKSDHELVYAKYRIPSFDKLGGAKKHKKYNQKSKKNKKNKKKLNKKTARQPLFTQ